MFKRIMSGAVLGGALVGGALALAPLSQAAPSGDTTPPCLAEHTCALLIPRNQDQARFLPLTPASSAPAH